MTRYVETLREAARFSRHSGIKFGEFVLNPKSTLNRITDVQLIGALSSVFIDESYGLQHIDYFNAFRDPKDRVKKCIPAHAWGMAGIKKLLGVNVYFTLGSVQHIRTGDPFYPISQKTLTNMLREKRPHPEVDLHAWLTLETSEIIDFTLSSTLVAKGKPYALDLPEVIKGDGDNAYGFCYTPVAVGRDWLTKTGLIVP